MHLSKAPVQITRSDRRFVVNRADLGDMNVVISWTDEFGQRQAEGLTPDEARKMAEALTTAAWVIEGEQD